MSDMNLGERKVCQKSMPAVYCTTSVDMLHTTPKTASAFQKTQLIIIMKKKKKKNKDRERGRENLS